MSWFRWRRVAYGPRPYALIIVLASIALVSGCGADAVITDGSPAASSASAALVPLPLRDGPRTETSHTVPHVQVGVQPVGEVDSELRRRIFGLPGVESRETIVSFAGTDALWLDDTAMPAQLVATLREREFGHIHPDGSLHIVLPVDRAIDATTNRWAELHPWVGRDDFWDGMVMLYTPQDFEELEVTWQLIVDAYNLVTGQSLDAGELANG